jgi:hypothetical protein
MLDYEPNFKILEKSFNDIRRSHDTGNSSPTANNN